jgi:hypothetical protein
MPYDNLPESEWAKMDRCVNDVMDKGHDKESAIAICYSSMVEGKELLDAMKEYAATHKASKNPGDYLVVEDPQAPTTWHLQVKTDGTPDHALMGAAWAALHEGYRGNKYEGPGKAEALAKLKKLYDDEGMAMPGMKEATLSVFKQANGKYRWVAFSSSSYQDREGEIVSQKALEDDTARMNATGQYGTLDWWHTPLIIGQCDFSSMHGKISVESGTFNDEWVGERMAAAKELAASRSFMHPLNEPDADGVYHHIETFSRAILPRGKESNLLTQVFVGREDVKMLADKIKEFVTKLGGDAAAEAKVAELLATAGDTEKAAEVAGIKNKEAVPAADPAPKTDPETPAPDKGWFVADMKPEEFTALLVTAMKSALDPMVGEIKAIKEAQGTAMKESGQAIVAKIAEVAKTQGDIATRVAALEGETPRAYRASKEGPEPDAALKEKKPANDEKVPYFSTFINNITGMGEAPKP